MEHTPTDDDIATLSVTALKALITMADGATLDDLREAVTTLEETKRTAQRLLGGAHPIVAAIERALGGARAALRARETPLPPSTNA